MKNLINFKTFFWFVTAFSFAISIVFFVTYKIYNLSVLLTLFITFFTIWFHFFSRLICGTIIPLFKSKINPNKKYYKVRKTEEKFYNLIKIKKWKKFLPTYDNREFNIRVNSPKELIVNMCNSELVHTFSALLSYLPLLLIIFFGSPVVFIITSIVASFVDLLFVMLQRYNRNRFVNLVQKQKDRLILTK